MATDSRISQGPARLIEEGIKLFEVPVICRCPGESGFFDVPYFTTTLGLACAGGTLVYQHVYGTLVPILANLIGEGSFVPTTADFASLAAEITTRYVLSLGQRRPNAQVVSIVVAGETGNATSPEAYRLREDRDLEGLSYFVADKLDLGGDRVHFFGHSVDEAQAELQAVQLANQPGAPRSRAALNVLRTFIDDHEKPAIGGEVQLGFTNGRGFQRRSTVVADGDRAPRALQLLNGIDLDQLGQVGPCAIGIPGMISP
jgi:hypothetical protein